MKIIIADMTKKRKLLPSEEDENRNKVNPFEKEDEEDGVDLDNPDSPKNSFLNEEDDIIEKDIKDVFDPIEDDDLEW